ncbi:hypothetical protein EJ08DRAFT_564039, partial [Tothia fuscella]
QRNYSMASEKTPITSYLLLLPPVPQQISYASIKAAYYAPLLATLRAIAHAKPGARVLDIALPCPHLYNHQKTTRSQLYSLTQTLVAKAYKLITIVLAVLSRAGFSVEEMEGIDPRIILLAYPRNGILDKQAQHELEGPIIDLRTLARSGRNWRKVFAVRNKQGEQLEKNFDRRSNPEWVPAGDGETTQSTASQLDFQQHPTQRYQHSAVGGTFDHLHIGHKLLLTMTVFPVDWAVGGEERAVTVGITARDLLLNKKYAEVLEDWPERYLSVRSFLDGILYFGTSTDDITITEVNEPGPNGHAILARYPSGLTIHYVEIWDPFGPTITEEGIDALVISAETRSGGKAVNQKRKDQGWNELEVFEVDVLDAEEEVDGMKDVQDAFQNKLSSTEIRRAQSER